MTEPMERLALVQSQLDALAQEIPRLVAQCRAQGASWRAIGRQLGTSRQAVQQRYGKRPADIDQLPLSDPLFDPLFHPPKD